MKINNLRFETIGNRSRIIADIVWEECERPGLTVFFETLEAYSNSLYMGFEPFLIGCMLPALHHREKRIKVEGKICPELSQNLKIAMSWIRHWFYPSSWQLVDIDAGKASNPKQPPMQERSGSFFSGGVDGLSTLKFNHMSFSQHHPAVIRDGLMISGQNIESDVRPETFQQAYTDLSRVVGEMGVTLIPVYTNIRLVDDSSRMFHINHGAILGAVAHAFSNRLTRVYISASDSITTLSLVNQLSFKPHGSHPLIDPMFSGYNMTIKHDGITLSRLDKVLLISNWYSGLQAIRVCGPDWPGENCCKCEKCVRTMLELLVAGVLHKTDAFILDDVTTEMISKIHIKKPEFGYSVHDDYLELIGPLERIGRQDLARAVLAMIDRSNYPTKNIRQKIEKLDAKYFDGSLSYIKKKLMGKSSRK